MNPGDTGAERAAYVQNSEWTRLVFVGRVLNETSYSIGGEVFDGGVASMPREFQNVTFSLDQTLFNSNSSGSFPPNVIVGDDGTMTVETHTETTCCLCGLTIGEVGTEYLVELGKNSDSLSSCGITCQTDADGGNVPNTWGSLCADTVTALGGTVANTPSNETTVTSTISPTPEFDDHLIVGPEWIALKYYNPSNEALVEPINGSTITYQMNENGQIRGYAGCNSMQGSYANLTEISFVIGSDVGWTEMGCMEPQGVMQQELDYFSNFYPGRKINWTMFAKSNWGMELTDADEGPNRGLELKDADTGDAIATFTLYGLTETMSTAPAAAASDSYPLIVGPVWTASKYYNPSNEALVPPIEGTPVSFRMMEDGRLNGNGGCNSMQGNYANLTSTSFVISSDVSWTEMYCAEPEGVMQQELDYFSNFYLGRKIDWFPMGDWGLELKDADTGDAIATFKLDGMVESTSASPTPSGAQKAVEVDTDVGIAPTPTASDASSNTILSPTTPTEGTTSTPASG